MRCSSLVFIWLGLITVAETQSAYAQKKKCLGATECPALYKVNPNPPPLFIPAGEQCTISEYKDTKQDEWKFLCTNVAGGNFEWWYDKFGMKVAKQIGKCDRQNGRNDGSGWIPDKPPNQKQLVGFKQFCHSATKLAKRCTKPVPGGPPGLVFVGNVCLNNADCPAGWTCTDNVPGVGNERTVREFDKAANKGKEWKETLDKNNPGSGWQKVTNSEREYESLALPYLNGDPATTVATALSEARLMLVARGATGNAREIRWSAFESADTPLRPPVLNTGDSVYLDGLSPGDVLSHDAASYSKSSAPPGGVMLTALQAVTLNTGDVLATIQALTEESIYYSVNVEGAVEFFFDTYNNPGVSVSLEDTPYYASTAGMLDLELGCCVLQGLQEHDVSESYCNVRGGTWTLGPVCIPTVSEWGVAALMLLILCAGMIVIMRARPEVAAD